MIKLLQNPEWSSATRFAIVGLIACWGALSWQPAAVAADSLATTGDQPDESAVAASIRLNQQLILYNDEIERLESAYGPYHQSLLEPLQGLTALRIEAGEFEAASRLLNRRLQLHRTLEGPANLQQLPLIAELISSNIARQQWQSVTEHFEFLQWLQTHAPDADPSAALNAMNDTSAWHLAAIYIDEPAKRMRHFLRSREITRDIVRLAEDEYGEDSTALIPWLYSYAVQQHRVYAFLDSEDELGAAAAADIARHEGRGQTYFLRDGLNIVKRLRSIVATMQDPEAEAMAMIYEADFLMLKGDGNAARLYRRAKLKLAEAGIGEERIEAFLARPVVLPVEHYHLSVEQALAAQAAYGYRVQAGTDDAADIVHLGDFIALNESLPFARRPPIPELAAVADTRELNVVEVLFSINSRGTSNNARAQQAEPDTVRVRRDARDAIEEMQFRPRFVQRRWRRIEDVTMRYLYPPAL